MGIRIILLTVIASLVVACNKPVAKVSQSSSTTTQRTEEVTVTQTTTKGGEESNTIYDEIELNSISKSDAEWKSQLNEIEYYVIREKGTERAFSGEYWDNKNEGIYICKACDLPLYDSKTKFKSGTGWPSYYQAIDKDFILKDTDYNLGYGRTELMCGRCEGHLGHVFSDGPEPTGQRHCINSASLEFVPKADIESFMLKLKSEN